jgi:hypothetical protein
MATLIGPKWPADTGNPNVADTRTPGNQEAMKKPPISDRLSRLWRLIFAFEVALFLALVIPPSYYTWIEKRAAGVADVSFGWGVRDRANALVEKMGYWADRFHCKMHEGDLSSDWGARQVVYELAEKYRSQIGILNVEPFVKQYIAGATRENALHTYWTTKARVDLKQDEPPGIRSDSFPPIVFGIIIDANTGSRYTISGTSYEKFLVTGDLSLLQSVNVFDTHLLSRDKSQQFLSVDEAREGGSR